MHVPAVGRCPADYALAILVALSAGGPDSAVWTPHQASLFAEVSPQGEAPQISPNGPQETGHPPGGRRRGHGTGGKDGGSSQQGAPI